MLADAYVDASSIMEAQPRLKTASHLISHLAREIDSGLRDLLVAILPAERQRYLAGLPKEHEDSYDPPRREVIAEICAFLRIPEQTGVATTWTRMKLAHRAHRDALRVPRLIDDEFLELWDDFVYILLMLGRGFEASYLAAAPVIDTLAATKRPTKANLETFRNKVPQSRVALDRFFSAAGPGWFYHLRRARYFEAPDPLQPDEDGLLSYVPWPPGPYLARMAAEPAHAAEVVAVFEALHTDNPHAGESAADAALVVPIELAARLAPKLAEFLQPFAQWALPSKAVKVVRRLATASHPSEAMTIVEALVPPLDGGGLRSRFIPLDDIAPAYADLGVDIVRLFADRLRDGNDSSDSRAKLAYSRIWRPSIAKDRRGDGRDTLVSALRDAAASVAGSAGVAPVVSVLDGYESALFLRVSLHLLTKFPASGLIEERLTSPEVFANDEVDPEYAALLRQEYTNLPETAQGTILALIDAGPVGDVPEGYMERWRYAQFARLGDHLPDRYQDELQALVARYGQLTDSDQAADFEVWPGPHSPFDAGELASMTDKRLIQTLATWREPGGWRAPTLDGLRVQLEEAISANPSRFSKLSLHFIDLDPTYGIALLTTLKRLAAGQQAGSSGSPPSSSSPRLDGLSWTDLLAFTQAVIDVPPSGDNQSAEAIYGPTWRGCRRYVAELLAAVMQRQVLPADHAGKVLGQLKQLAEDSDASASRSTPNYADPLVAALNDTRPLALAAVIQLIRWIDTDPNAPSMPEYDRATDALDTYLDDDSPAVRSVYGMYVSVLLAYLREWTQTNRSRIFDSSNIAAPGYAAWQTFLRTNQPSRSTYELLIREYRAAVAHVPTEMPDEDADRPLHEAIDHLAGHIAVLYWWGLIPLSDEIITTLFTSDIPVQLRGRVIEICGQILADMTEPAPDFAKRMQDLWEWREAQLNTDATIAKELRSVGWWMTSTIIPPDWALTRLLNLLHAGGAPEPDHMVAKRLAELAPDHLASAVLSVRLLIDAPTDRWFIDGSHKEIAAVLTAGVHSAEAATRQEAADTVNRLVARGRTSFANILG